MGMMGTIPNSCWDAWYPALGLAYDKHSIRSESGTILPGVENENSALGESLEHLDLYLFPGS